MKTFVTGGDGLVGRALVAELLARHHEVLVLTRRADHVAAADRTIRRIHGDLRDAAGVAAALTAHKPEAFVHLAWEGLPDYSLGTCLRNLEYGVRLFRDAAAAGCSSLISTGSCWEYASRHGRLSEGDPLGAAEPFPAVKNALRFIGEATARQHGRRFYWLRLFFVYGPGQRPSSLIPHVVEALMNGRKPKLQSPTNRHDFVFVEDVARALVDVLERQPPDTVYNVGSGEATPVAEVVRLVHQALGKPYDPDGLDTERSDPRQEFWADVSRLRRATGWRARYDLKAGVARSIGSALRVGAWAERSETLPTR